MNSVKTKCEKFAKVGSKGVAGVVLVPESGHFQAYVAWEWEDQAEKGFFAIIKSPTLIGGHSIDGNFIDYVADFGHDVTHDKEIRKLFPLLF